MIGKLQEHLKSQNKIVFDTMKEILKNKIKSVKNVSVSISEKTKKSYLKI
jgi:hypothetical protein